jgi:aquaporin Z
MVTPDSNLMNLPLPPGRHWPEYLIEGASLGLFMISATLFTILLEHPASPVRRRIRHAPARRAAIGLAMGLTAVALIYSPWGQRSGAQMNPAVTLAFLHLGTIQPVDAAFYIAAQFLGGASGVLLVRAIMGSALAHQSVNHAMTVPGPRGAGVAFVAEAAISFVMMLMVLWTTNTPGLAGWTGLFAGGLVFLYITFEAPLSGMSMNPARTAASALASGRWTSTWIYFTAPVLGMLIAAHLFAFHGPATPRACPSLSHGSGLHCFFCATKPGRVRPAETPAETPAESAPGPRP